MRRDLAHIGAKQKNVPEEKRDAIRFDDVWTGADSKLIVSWLVGPRDGGAAYTLMQNVATRLRNRVQLTTDASGRSWTPLKIRRRGCRYTTH